MKTSTSTGQREHTPLELIGRRLPLPPGKGENRRLSRMTIMLEDDRMTISIAGYDRPGILRYVSRICAKHGANITGSIGDRLDDAHGSFYEVIGSKDRLVQLSQELMQHQDEPIGSETIWPDTIFDLAVDIPQDRPGILSAIAEMLFRRKINISIFKSRSRPAFSSLVGPDDGSGGADIRARLEIPAGITPSEIEEEIRHIDSAWTPRCTERRQARSRRLETTDPIPSIN